MLGVFALRSLSSAAASGDRHVVPTVLRRVAHGLLSSWLGAERLGRTSELDHREPTTTWTFFRFRSLLFFVGRTVVAFSHFSGSRPALLLLFRLIHTLSGVWSSMVCS